MFARGRPNSLHLDRDNLRRIIPTEEKARRPDICNSFTIRFSRSMILTYLSSSSRPAGILFLTTPGIHGPTRVICTVSIGDLSEFASAEIKDELSHLTQVFLHTPKHRYDLASRYEKPAQQFFPRCRSDLIRILPATMGRLNITGMKPILIGMTPYSSYVIMATI
jgi:hypothetical protein